jgi:hypothetical protein
MHPRLTPSGPVTEHAEQIIHEGVHIQVRRPVPNIEHDRNRPVRYRTREIPLSK